MGAEMDMAWYDPSVRASEKNRLKTLEEEIVNLILTKGGSTARPVWQAHFDLKQRRILRLSVGKKPIMDISEQELARVDNDEFLASLEDWMLWPEKHTFVEV